MIMQYVHNHLKNNNDILPVGKKRKSLNSFLTPRNKENIDFEIAFLK